jgi:ATP-dependent Clp protease ATP-binding subunit ClpC
MERFSERALRVVDVARDEARQLDHPYLGTEHLLLGLIAVEGPAHDALLSAGATADAARAKVAEAVARRGAGQPVEPKLSARAGRAIDRASRLSLHRRDLHVDPEHLLIGVLDVEGRAGQVLRGLGIDVSALRTAIDLPRASVRRDEERTPAPEEGVAPTPHCAVCGTGLDDAGLGYRIVAASDDGGHHRKFAVVSCSGCGAIFGASPA